jgi:hypothetical protein
MADRLLRSLGSFVNKNKLLSVKIFSLVVCNASICPIYCRCIILGTRHVSLCEDG